MRPVIRPNRRAFYNMKTGRAQTRRGALRLFLALRKIVLRTDRPPVIGLMECRGNWSVIDRIARRYGYRVVTGVGTEGSSSALLIRDGVKILDKGMIGTGVTWDGPKGRAHAGRRFPWATIELQGVRRTFVVVHMPWNPRANEKAWNACLAALYAFSADGQIEYMGDWNTTRIAAIARRLRARVVRTGDRLMYALVRPAPGEPLTVLGDAKSTEGSDHPYVVLRDFKEVSR